MTERHGIAGESDAIRIAPQVVDAAVAWAVRIEFGEPDVETQRAFEVWRQALPSHALAWQRVSGLKQDFAAVPDGLASAVLDDVQRLRNGRGLGRRRALKTLMLGGVAVGAGWMAQDSLPLQRLRADHYTAVGERRRVMLADGSVLDLNTDTAVGIDLRPEGRWVSLRRGEIRVETGSDGGRAMSRPFQVRTRFGVLQALGTRFTVRLEDDGVRVDVQNGIVRLLPLRGAGTLDVHSGGAGRLAGASAMPAPARGFSADGWAWGVISVSDARLDELLAELARHRHGVLRCDPAVAGRRVSGIFHLDDIDAALRFLAGSEGLALRHRTRFWVSLGPRTGPMAM